MDTLSNDYPDVFWAQREPPCLSLYQPTHRQHPDNQQDPIRFRNLIRTLEESLQRAYPPREIEPLLAPYRALLEDRPFWNNSFDGLAVLGAPGFFRAYRLQRPVSALAIVAESFHIKPLIRILQSADRYQILALSRETVRLFEGDRDHLDEIDLVPEVPRSPNDVLSRNIERERATRTHGRVKPAMGLHGPSDVKESAIDSDTEHFFRAVDRAMLEHYSNLGQMPLLLAALPEHQALFRKISRNPHLLAEAIEINPEALSNNALHERSWQAFQPRYLDRLAGLIEAFGAASAENRATDELLAGATAAVAGRIETLLLDADRQIPGRLDAATGAVTLDELEHPGVDDVLDDIGEYVLKTGGEVIVVPAERMPTATGLAAIYRF